MTTTTTQCWAFLWYWPCLSAEAWAAWAQAIMSAGAIIVSVLITQSSLNRTLRSNEKLQEREHKLQLAVRVAPLYAAAFDLAVEATNLAGSLGFRDTYPPAARLPPATSDKVEAALSRLVKMEIAEMPLQAATLRGFITGFADEFLKVFLREWHGPEPKHVRLSELARLLHDYAAQLKPFALV